MTLSDALCRLATGGGLATRELYTDFDEIIFDAQRPIVLNGIEDVATRGDFADRAIVVYLEAISKVRDEEVFWAEFGAAQPRILAALLDAMVSALSRIETTLNSLFRFVEKIVADAESARLIPYDVTEGSTRYLVSLIESIRVQRNDAVHPMNAQVSGNSVRLSFGSFPHALEKQEALRAWFLGNPKSI